MTNQWNRVIYRIWAPLYDALPGRVYASARRRTVAALAVRAGQLVLLPGVGTGADLPLLPRGVTAVGVDLSRAMLARARARLPLAGRSVALVCADVQALPLAAGVFDAALLDLIVSVAPDGAACLREAARAMRPGGPIVIFDKFLKDGAVPGVGRRLLNLLARCAGTDINRRLGDLVAEGGCVVVADRPGALGGAYRTVIVQAAHGAPRLRAEEAADDSPIAGRPPAPRGAG